MKGVARIAVLYTVFAVLSSAVNIGGQALAIWLYHGTFAVPLSILFGTAAGLPVKYVLEKRHIFNFVSQNFAHDRRIFILYSFMGLFTTALFLGTEYAFHLAFSSDIMRYVGGMIGLAIGNLIKYHLDKHFVFIHRLANAPEIA